MATAAIEGMSGPTRTRKKRELRQPPFALTDIVCPDEIALGLGCSRSQVYQEIIPRVKVSYVLGPQSPRVLWSEVLKLVESTASM
jgi:hypothetical protein